MARELWVGGWGGGQGIGLVGNLAKKQSADLLCSWQAWEPARMNPTPPLTHSLPLGFCSVCVGMWRDGGRGGQEGSGGGGLPTLCVCMYVSLWLNVTESERKLSLNSCHCGLIISVCFTHISSVSHGKCGQQRAFMEVKSLFSSLVLKMKTEAGLLEEIPSQGYLLIFAALLL